MLTQELSELLKQKETITNKVISISKDFIYDEVQFTESKLIEYIEYTLEYLNAAYVLKEEALLVDYLLWLQDLLLRNGSKDDFLENYLEGLNHVIFNILNKKEISQLLNKGILTLKEYKGPSDVSIGQLSLENQEFFNMLLKHRSTAIVDALKPRLIKNVVSLSQIYNDMIVPIQQEVGRLWQVRQLTVADEHYITESLVRVADEIFSIAKKKKILPHGNIMIFSIEKEKHAFGVRLISNTLLSQGYQALCYGSDLPIQDMIRVIEKENPKIVIISVTFAKNIVSAKNAIEKIKGLDKPPTIFLGGRAFNLYPYLVNNLGGDYYTKDLLSLIFEIKKVLNEGEQ